MGIIYVAIAGAFENLRSAIARSTAALIVAAICIHHVATFTSKLGLYGRVAMQSANFIADFPAIASTACSRAEPITALYPKRNYLGYMFLQEGALGRYICGPGAAATAFDSRFKFASFESDPHEVAPDGSIRIVFDDSMKLARVAH
jgi:hypothetical protein